MSGDADPIACSLTSDAARNRGREWSALIERALADRARAPGGVRLELRPLEGVAAELTRLVAAERVCCSFMRMEVDQTESALVLTVTAPALAEPLLYELFGAVS